MLETLEYILIATKSLCIIAMISIGLSGKWKRLTSRLISAFGAVIMLTVLYLFLHKLCGIGYRFSCAAAFTVLTVLYGILCFEDDIKQRLIFLLSVILLSTACTYVSNAVFFIYSGHSDFLQNTGSALGEIAVIATEINIQLIVIGSFVILWNRLYRHQKTVKYIAVYLIFPMSQFVTLFFLNGEKAYRHLFGNAVSVIGVLIGYIADIVLYYMLLNQEHKKELKNRLEETKRVQEIEKAHFDAVEAARLEIDRLSRDFDRQLTEIIDSVENGKKEKADIMFNQLKMDVSATRECQYCSNAVVNAVLTDKEKQARLNSINMDINLTVRQEISISAMHLCSVFSNLLDNAIHATAVYDGERTIHINAGYAGDYFFVKVENNCTKPARKSVRKGHGYGLKILDDIARQYDGKFNHSWQEEIYTARIMLTVY